MKADISADLHAPAKRYSGVRAQQGRVLTDADFNAALDVVDDALEHLVRSLLCAAGTPDNGFGIGAAAPATFPLPDGSDASTLDFSIAPGSFVLGGRALVLRAPWTFLDQSDWLSLALDPGTLPPAPIDGRNDLAYLEMIVQPVRAVEDREIQERALGSADTTSRLRPQMKVRVLDAVTQTCETAAVALRAKLAGSGGSFSDDGTEILSNARLFVGFSDDGAVTDPCAPRSQAGYLGAENQTLKVMLTEPGRFVWAFDHGEPLYRVQVDAASGEVLFLTEPRDPVLFPRTGQVIEILPWDALLPNREKAAAPLGQLARFTGEYDPAERRIAYDGSLPADWQTWLDNLPAKLLGRDDQPPRFFFARIWQEPDGGGVDQPTGAEVPLPDTGLELTFSGTGFAGDYWTVALRPDTPEIVVPWQLQEIKFPNTPQEIRGAPPIGPRRFYAPLAILPWRADAAGNLVATPDDCRNRFRRLCRIKSCCTFQVGDGDTTFGDFNDLQDAIEALPAGGGEICLLPGRHVGVADLSDRSQILIHGCGPRTLVVAPEGATDPVFRLDGAQDIGLRDFRIEHSAGLAVEGSRRTRRLLLRDLDIRVTGSAVRITSAADVTIDRCHIQAIALPRAIQADDAARQAPLVYLRGQQLTVERCRLFAAAVENRNLAALGGLHVGGDSSEVRILDNHIRGGNGNGITLGSVVPRGDVKEDSFQIAILSWIAVDTDGCITLKPGGTAPPDDVGLPQPPVLESQGPVTRLEIRRNRIEGQGGSGVSVAHWFIPDEGTETDELDDIEIEDAVIADNVIERCMLLDLASGLPVEAAFGSAFGGIVLASAVDLQVENNDIRGCGGEGRTPICGIFLRYGERIHVTENRIYDNGRPASLTDPLLVGNIGGIVLSHVEGSESGLGVALRQTPAAFIKDNTVVSPEGRALELFGSGQMMVEGNAFTVHGNNSLGVLLFALLALTTNATRPGQSLTGPGVQGQFRAFVAQLGGSAVAIVNEGLNPNLALLIARAYLASQSQKVPSKGVLRQNESPRAFPPQGPVLFNDNMVTFDALSSAATLSLSSVLIVSLDDVGMHDNHCAVDVVFDFVFINALVLGFTSARVQGNRFRELRPFAQELQTDPLLNTFLSAATLGYLNATEMNQGTHCFLRIGARKPRIVPVANRFLLDTNRHVVDDRLCVNFDQTSFAQEEG